MTPTKNTSETKTKSENNPEKGTHAQGIQPNF